MEILNDSLHAFAEIQLSYKPLPRTVQHPRIKTLKELHALVLSAWNHDTISYLKEFKILLLDSNRNIIGIAPISTGGTTESTIDAKVVFAIVLKAAASYLILLHNYPSGDVKPTRLDIVDTGILQDAARLLDIRVIDHLLISPDNYFSFDEHGILPP